MICFLFSPDPSIPQVLKEKSLIKYKILIFTIFPSSGHVKSMMTF